MTSLKYTDAIATQHNLNIKLYKRFLQYNNKFYQIDSEKSSKK